MNDTSPTITNMLDACGQSPSRFLLELQRQRAALLIEVRTGLTLSRNQSPALHRTIRDILTEAIGPDPKWLRTNSSLLACFDAYVVALEAQWGESKPLLTSTERYADLFTPTEIARADSVLAFAKDNLR